MKNFILIFLVSGLLLNTAGLNLYAEKNQSHTYQIQKSKRYFLKPDKRSYLKNIPLQGMNSNTNKEIEELIRRGIKKDSLMDYKGAFDEFASAIRINPKNSEANYYLGLMKFQMEDFGNSLIDFEIAIANDTLCEEAYFTRGNALFELKQYKEAIDNYNKAIMLNKEDNEAYYNRAIANYYLGNGDAACKDLESALKYKNKEAYIAFGEICR
jgi:tetratricopeptide (TPR) repeat protein